MHNDSVQKKIDDEVERVYQLIEQTHLNKYQESWSVVRSYYLYCDAISLNKNQVAGEISIIEYYISDDVDKERVLEKLIQKHWYVALLMRMSVDKAIAKMNKVRGSKIDERCHQFMKIVWQDTDVRVAEGMIYNSVLEHFYRELDEIDNRSLDTVPQELRSIYFTVLKGADQIESSSLSLSQDGQYIRVTNYPNVDTIWYTASGRVVTDDIDLNSIKHCKSIEWIPAERDRDWRGYEQSGEKYSVATANCHVTVKNLPILDMMQQSFSHIGSESKVISLFKKPEIPLYFYQKAFENSKNNLSDLIALRDSKSLAETKGFAQANFKQIIAQRIKQLTSEK